MQQNKTRLIGKKLYEFYPPAARKMGDRNIKGREIIEWIQKNELEDVNILHSAHGLYYGFTEVKDPDHYREYNFNWDKRRPKHSVTDDRTDPN